MILNSLGLSPRQGVLDIETYVPGGHKLKNYEKPIVLSANETPLGPSPKARAAYLASSDNLERYPDGSAKILKNAIAEVYDINPAQIVCGSGSDELLSLIAQSYLSANDEAIHTEYGFLIYKVVILASGAKPVASRENNFVADIDNILSNVTKNTKIVFLANPNNPTGTFVSIEDVRRLRRSLSDNILLVIDGAYAEYVCQDNYKAVIELVETTYNTIMTRTFSKIHGLAALRLGWAYCSAEVANVLNRVRGPFNVNSPAISAGAAAIMDFAHMERARYHNDIWLVWLTKEVRKLGLEVTDSVGNFILINFPEGCHDAFKANKFLQNSGIICRRTVDYGLNNSLRVTIGKERENRILIDTLSRFISING
ncbi:MAG: Histidinol-phosphate aminotransferase [Hyphomicrobiaceae bacterium hypho_1]